MKAVAVLCLALLAGWPLVSPAQNTHTLPLVRPAGFAGQESLVRIVNRSDTSGTVRITAIDDTGERFGPVILTLDARQAVNITSRNLERGNTAVGLPVGIGDGSGSWRLELETALTIEALAYIRTPDGFLTSMHDVASMSEGGDHWVPIFNPGSNTQKVSHLRLINPGSTAAEVTVTGRDDLGDVASGTVSLTLPAGAARTLTAQALEAGGEGFDGRLGDGAGKWRLNVRSTTDIQVMSLLATPTGHLANLSTAPNMEERRPEDDTCDMATVVGANSTTAGRLETQRDIDAFRFELPSVGNLVVRSTAADGRTSVGPDTVGRLYRGDTEGGWTEVAWDDDAVGVHFRIDVPEAQAGTWCVTVAGIGTATGAYTLHVEFDGEPPPDDHGNTRDTATSARIGSSMSGRLETSGDVDVFRFELVNTGSLYVHTTGSTDTVGRLELEDYTFDQRDDNGGPGSNFRIDVPDVQAGSIWYVYVRGSNGATGAYELYVENDPSPPDDHGDRCIPATTATVVGANSTTAGRLETRGDVDAFRFELPSAGRLQVQTTGSTDTVGRLYRGTLRGSDDDGGTGTNFRITEAEAQAGTWCVEVGGYRNATGPYTLQVEFSSNGGPIDVGVPSTTPGRLETQDDVDVFRFELPSADRLLLRVQTTGSTDTVGRLLYRGTTLRGSDDDGGTGTNFRITEAEAQAGTWHVEVRGYRNATGPYTLHVETQRGVCGWDYAGWAAGHALNRGSEAAARRDAINWCTQHARPFEYSRDCTVRASFRSCGAVAFGARNDGSSCLLMGGSGSSRGAAERNALTACQNFREGAYRPCRIAVTDRPTSTRLSFCNSSGHGAIATTWAFRSAPAIGGSGGKSAEKQEVSGEEDSSVSTSRAPQ